MRIGVNALYLIPGAVGGTEIYLRHLLRALAEINSEDEYVLFTNLETGPDLAPARPSFRMAPQAVRAAFRPARIVWEQAELPFAARRERVDVLLNPGFTAPLVRACPNVTVFHDLQHKRHPEYFRWFDLPAWQLLLWAAVHRSALLLADSEATRADLLRFYRVPEAKVRTAPLGVDPRFFDVGRERCTSALEPFLLCASTLHPHKNIVPLLRAYAGLRRSRPEFSLVITGVRGFAAEAVESAVRELGLERNVRLAGWLPREELYALFRHAYAFVYPSTFEGFGLPVVEAMAAGVPTACSSVEPVHSVAGDAALQFDPLDQAAMLGALDQIVSNDGLRARLSAAGPLRAEQFSWKNTAEITLTALRDAVIAANERK